LPGASRDISAIFFEGFVKLLAAACRCEIVHRYGVDNFLPPRFFRFLDWGNILRAKRIIQAGAFDPADVERLQTAFDLAWERMRSSVNPEDHARAREALAVVIVSSGTVSGLDSEELATLRAELVVPSGPLQKRLRPYETPRKPRSCPSRLSAEREVLLVASTPLIAANSAIGVFHSIGRFAELDGE
jgi:hypothetical protein